MFPSFYHRVESTVDAYLAVSRDSHLWQRPERRPIIDLSYENGEYGAIYAGPGLVALESGEWRLPIAGFQRKHDFRGRDSKPQKLENGDIRWAVWGADRLCGLEAAGEGRVILNMRKCAGEQMRLNYRTEKDGWV